MSIQLRDVMKSYGDEYVLKPVNLTFQKGRIYGLLGPNGSGKSTLLKLITGLSFPNSGTVTVNNQTVTRKTCQSVAYLTELDMFYENFTVKETIDYTASQFADFNREKAQELLKEMKLDANVKR